MSVYSISSITVKDWDTYQEYMKRAAEIIAMYGGKYLVRGGEILADSTSWHPKRVVILEFPTIEKMEAFRDSDEAGSGAEAQGCRYRGLHQETGPATAEVVYFQGEAVSPNPDARAKAKAIFLLTFRKPRSVLAASEAAGVDRTTIFRWRQVDQEVDRLYRVAREDGTDVIEDVVYEQALAGHLAACGMVLKWRGAFPGDLQWEGGGEETAVGAAFTVEDLAQRAIDRGYITVPKSPKEIDGADIAKVE